MLIIEQDSLFLLQDAALDNQTLVSPVLASSVGNLSLSDLTENIEFVIQNTEPVDVSTHTHPDKKYK